MFELSGLAVSDERLTADTRVMHPVHGIMRGEVTIYTNSINAMATSRQGRYAFGRTQGCPDAGCKGKHADMELGSWLEVVRLGRRRYRSSHVGFCVMLYSSSWPRPSLLVSLWQACKGGGVRSCSSREYRVHKSDGNPDEFTPLSLRIGGPTILAAVEAYRIA